mmetsp:Transcript_19822/g.78980  ORF Transcript_19822/g.78980 Transcript_19822/m.78980 type:complete len:208 (-) Transcript_19822:1528-2151(-)
MTWVDVWSSSHRARGASCEPQKTQIGWSRVTRCAERTACLVMEIHCSSVESVATKTHVRMVCASSPADADDDDESPGGSASRGGGGGGVAGSTACSSRTAASGSTSVRSVTPRTPAPRRDWRTKWRAMSSSTIDEARTSAYQASLNAAVRRVARRMTHAVLRRPPENERPPARRLCRRPPGDDGDDASGDEATVVVSSAAAEEKANE